MTRKLTLTATVSTALLALAIFAAPQAASADETTVSPKQELQQISGLTFKPMYVQVEPDSLETLEEIEKQMSMVVEQSLVEQNMAASSDDDDC